MDYPFDSLIQDLNLIYIYIFIYIYIYMNKEYSKMFYLEFHI